VSTRLLGRAAELRAVTDFLDAASRSPAGLLVEGEAGIGKSTLHLAALDEAQTRGFRILSAGAAAAESVLAYAVLSDLLRGLDAIVFEDLPDVQLNAIERVLTWAHDNGRPTLQQEVAAGFLAILERLTDEGPTLLAVDDLQWLDASSQKVLAYAVRRATGPIGVLASIRTDATGGDPAAWLQMCTPDALNRLTLSPMNLGSLHAVVAERLRKTIRRPTMVRICEASGGNPFYTLELARIVDDSTRFGDLQMPRNLAELVNERIGRLDADVREILLAAACVAEPTVELLSAATGREVDNIFDMLAHAERTGIVEIDRRRLKFEHPLLARGVYTTATTAARRAMHRRLAEIVEQPELRARHLALSSAHGDGAAIAALDEAAEIARSRGAPATAGELIDLAVDLGGDTIERRMRSARCHFNAGDAGRARTLLIESASTTGRTAAEALTLLGVMEILEGSLSDAATLLQRALDECGEDLGLRVEILIPLSLALFNSGQRDGAATAADEAVTAAEHLDDRQLYAQALSMKVLLDLWLGRGADDAGMRRALDMEDRDAMTSMVTRPSMHHAMVLAFKGELDEAHHAMHAMRTYCGDRGEESERVFVAFHQVLLEIWRGKFAEATVIADDAAERARLLEGDLPRGVALTMTAALAAYGGRLDDAIRDADAALDAVRPAGSFLLSAWPVMMKGFAEVSRGHYNAAVSVLDPLLSTLDTEATEIFFAAFLPDAVEALVAVGRTADAEPLIVALERNGNRLDRPWMRAMGARGRAMLLAAGGDIDGAHEHATAALTHHDSLPMPFERARTQVLLGQIQRRQRRKEAATNNLREALAAFESMGVVQWAERARAELARADVAHLGTDELTPSEQRVAELAASGMSNKDIAAKLFISPKTVETNLARTYRKLEIHSRTQLANRLKRRNM
jgi:ATP/maltotriose-dependent transcriptional regulator MalT